MVSFFHELFGLREDLRRYILCRARPGASNTECALHKAGCGLIFADSAESALKTLKPLSEHFLISDEQMPDMSQTALLEGTGILSKHNSIHSWEQGAPHKILL
jgi:hypothetical protein